MKKSLSIFRLALLAIFFIFFVIGFILFATFQAENQEEKIRADIKIYGTFDENIINALIKNLNFRNLNFSNLSYTQFDHNEYEMGILRSIAAGDPPDLILISNENLFNYSNKIKKIPIEVYSIRTFVDTFVDAFSIFYSDNGIFALPFIIDPMVMYYNKDIFNNYAIATPPKY
ncbi:MAG: extracellular solute-binding protein [Candidatus Pacebacteria bacterium]|nr:extracellular solute-binding protein [Candidatus Paceibacterota bacterium]